MRLRSYPFGPKGRVWYLTIGSRIRLAITITGRETA